ncbi:matrix metalloproteinase-20 isoform X2 [Astyanax mexicanus]|uniref:matrix metalloproteinase-20 isoform X2 n=1 Tax=Astyanax mexicanus TaxID=7994 RepID=UPI0020CACF85|nr:matrix metalloproteinase-20 isoform X2 [Astyanax mexicanus]
MERMWPWIFSLSWLLTVDLMWSSPVPPESGLSSEDIQHAEEYLKQFYHFSESPRKKRHSASMEEKIKEMQSFFGLPNTGHLDPQTFDIMKQARCGVPDVENYSLYPGKSKWKNHTITYRIAKYTTDLTKQEVENSFHLAFKLWSDVVPLRFVRVNHSKADIVITFTRKEHGDFFAFDGPKGVLAHAFEPGEGMGGDMHFDDDELWTVGNRKSVGYNLFTVAAHELGHSLGLSHSKDPSALMFPKYTFLNAATYKLPEDDTLGIQALYGKRIQNVQNNDKPLVSKRCDPSISFDAVAVIGDEILFFKNSYVWLRTMWRSYWNRLREGLMSKFLPSISSPVDAAYHLPAKAVTYIFTGPKYWVVQKLGAKSYYGSIYDYGFPARVKRIDAAVHISKHGKTFFFTGDMYYRYDEYKRRMDPGFPRKIHMDWPGITGRIDAAFELRGAVHFFMGSKASVFDYRQGRLLYVMKSNDWLGC